MVFVLTEPELMQNFWRCFKCAGEPEEPEVSGDASSVAAAQSASGSAEAGTLLEVTFQKNPRQKYKYLEAEPKILGVHVKLKSKENTM